MKKWYFIAMLFAFVSSGCIKNDQGCTNQKPESEEPQIQAYATANGITATKHSSGLYYQVINPGTGATPTLNSRVYITYTGKLLNGQVFDQSTDASKSNWILRELIEGWQVGLPLIKKGGEIKLIIPSAMAYGCNATGPIPGNSILYFDINLVDVQ